MQKTIKFNVVSSTNIDAENGHSPLKFSLGQNYPNPFNPGTTIHFTIPVSSVVSLEIFDMLGKKINTLVSGVKPAGEYTIYWDSKDEKMNSVASGIYYYHLKMEAPGKTQARTGKMVLMR